MNANTIRTSAIILARTDYGEADRILTVITPDHGKLRLMAKGVRRVKSKLAGGIELFSTSDIAYLPGRGEIGTLVSTRLIRHFGGIVGNIERVQLGYELIKQLNKATEDEPEADYYHLLEHSFEALDDNTVDPLLIRLWFIAQLLRLSGHAPNLEVDTEGNKLEAGRTYNFDYENVAFAPRPDGGFGTSQIKTLRLLFSESTPQALSRVQGIANLIPGVAPLIQTLQSSYLRS